MNSSFLFPNLWRFIGLVLLQGLVLHQVALNIGEYFNVLLYPLFILFLPVQLPTPYAVLLGFACGMVVDLFYGSHGVHASAGAFSGFARSFILTAFAPRGGFTGKEPIAAPAHFGWQWFLQVAGLFFALHLFWYFAVEAFTFVYFTTISLKTAASWVLTMLFTVFYGFLFNPKI
jgi:hypothetical protein